MKFGVLGDAKIAREKLLPAIRAAGHEVTHLGRRDPSGGAARRRFLVPAPRRGSGPATSMS